METLNIATGTTIKPDLSGTVLETQTPAAHPAPSIQETNTVLTELQEKVAQLQQQLLSAHPLIPTLLRTIHTQLRNDPEIVTLMSDEEIGIIVSGLKIQTNTEISTQAVKKSASATKSLKKLDINDL